MNSPRKTLVAVLAIAIISTFTLSPAYSAEPRPGRTCTKAGLKNTFADTKITCIKSGKKLTWTKVQPKPMPKSKTKYYVAKDQTTVRLLKAKESCSNPKNATFEIQAFSKEKWLPVKTLEAGWNTSKDCTDPGLGKRNYFGWAKVYLDEGTQYRWVFSGEINMEFRDANGRAYSQTSTIPVSLTPTNVTHDPNQTPLSTVTDSAKQALANLEFGIPKFKANNGVSISSVGSQTLTNFLPATTKEKYSFIGPTPLAEIVSDRSGAVSLITEDNRLVYQSRAAIPPWGAAFNFKTLDPQGRFVVTTSAFGNNGQSSWRLAFKKDGEKWQYQSVAGTLHQPDNRKYFDLVSLGAPGNYSIKLEFDWNITFYGVAVNDSPSSLNQLDISQPLKVMVIGDSWTWPVITDTVPFTQWDGYPLALSWLSGWNVMAAGVPGQGYLQVAAGETYRDRVVRDIASNNPDVVIFTGSPNDHCEKCTWSDHEIALEVSEDIKLLQKSYPHALVILCSPFTSGQLQNSEMSAVAHSLGVPYIDFFEVALFTQDNNGQRELMNGHPTRAGGEYIAKELLKAIAALG